MHQLWEQSIVPRSRVLSDTHSASGYGAGGAQRVHLVHFVISAGVALSIVGAVQSTSSDASTRDHSATFRKAGSLVTFGAYAALLFFLTTAWTVADRLSKFHRKVSKLAQLRFLVILMILCAVTGPDGNLPCFPSARRARHLWCSLSILSSSHLQFNRR